MLAIKLDGRRGEGPKKKLLSAVEKNSSLQQTKRKLFCSKNFVMLVRKSRYFAKIACSIFFSFEYWPLFGFGQLKKNLYDQKNWKKKCKNLVGKLWLFWRLVDLKIAIFLRLFHLPNLRLFLPENVRSFATFPPEFCDLFFSQRLFLTRNLRLLLANFAD